MYLSPPARGALPPSGTQSDESPPPPPLAPPPVAPEHAARTMTRALSTAVIPHARFLLCRILSSLSSSLKCAVGSAAQADAPVRTRGFALSMRGSTAADCGRRGA